LLTSPLPVHDERANLIYLTIFQIFSVWFIPFYRAPVRLVTVLHLAPYTASSDNKGEGIPPPPYDAAQEKLHAVQEGAEPSYAAVTSGDAPAATSTSPTSSTAEGSGSGSGSGGSGDSGPTRYVIAKQQDLYQVNEFVKFVSLAPGSAIASFLQLFATLVCLAGVVVLGPLVKAVWPSTPAGKAAGAKEGGRKEKQR
jgi:hypothetical protein